MPIKYNNDTITKILTSSGDTISYIMDNADNIITDFRDSEPPDLEGAITDSWDVISERSNAGTAPIQDLKYISSLIDF